MNIAGAMVRRLLSQGTITSITDIDFSYSDYLLTS